MQTRNPAFDGPMETNSTKALNNYLFLIGIDQYVHQTRLFNAVAGCKGIQEILSQKYQFRKTELAYCCGIRQNGS